MSYTYPFQISSDNSTWHPLNGTNNYPAIKYQGATYSRQSVDGSSAGRNQSGAMIRDQVASKDKWQLEFTPCTTAQLHNLLTILDSETFYFKYPSPMTATGMDSNEMYCGDRSMPVYLIDHDGQGVDLWGNLTVNFIEM